MSEAPVQKLLHGIAWAWACLRDVGTVVRPCRFSVFMVFAGGALLLASPQGQELSVRLPDQGAWKVLLFYLCVFLWAFQSWYWARFILDARLGPERRVSESDHPRRERIERLINHTPRVIAVLAYAVAVLACLASGKSATIWVGLGLLPQGALFYFLLVRRSRLTVALVRRLPALGDKLNPREDLRTAGLRGLAPLSRWVLVVTLASGAGLMAWAWLYPVGLGWFFGSSAVPFLGFAMIVPVGSLAVYAAREGGILRLAEEQRQPRWNDPGYPVVSALVVLALIFSLWLDNHEVRTLAGPPPQRDRSLAAAAERWLQQAPRNPDGSVNAIVVATAGGGIRAAYWTATVLGAIQDRAPAFRQQLLGISGVSGGSLGASVFATLLAQERLPDRYSRCETTPARPGWPRGAYECAGQTVLSQDFLAPVAAAALFTDLLQRFVPVAFLPDRAQALEEGWEQAWPRAGFAHDIWSRRSFDALWAGDRHLPWLLLNGTHVDSGKRIITSNLDIGTRVFPDAYDFFALVPKPIRPSTAALNSARFTYVSPAGTLGPNGRIIDGGYFENFGAGSARDLLQAMLRRTGATLQPIVILITNDPGLPEDEMPATAGRPRAEAARLAVRTGNRFAGELLSPIRGLLATRGAHGILATDELAAAVGRQERFFHFRLCPEHDAKEPALGWVLSSESEELMRRQLRNADCGNAKEFDLLMRRLAAAGGS